jgi:hypothetical protein
MSGIWAAVRSFLPNKHVNPLRTQENAIFMMESDTPWFGIITFIGTLLVFTLPQFFQAEVISALEQIFGDRARFAALLALPLTAVLTWYCYDYLTPSNVCFGGCPELYEHGFSLSRYVRTLAVQTPITLFSFLYLDADLRGVSRVPALLGALTLAVVAGGFWGYVRALG